MSSFPFLNLTLFTLKDVINSVILSLKHTKPSIMVGKFILNILELGQLTFPILHSLLPLLNLIKLIPQHIVQPLNFPATNLQLTGKFLIIMCHFLGPIGFLLEPATPDLPFLNFLYPILHGRSQLFVLVFPLLLLLQLLV